MAQFWSNKISILLCEGPKANMSMISGFVDFNMPKYVKQYREMYGHISEQIIFVNLGIQMFDLIVENPRTVYCLCLYVSFLFVMSGISFFIKFCEDGQRKNDENRINKISKIMDMNFIPIKKQEMEIW